jgi:hypothetical protein
MSLTKEEIEYWRGLETGIVLTAHSQPSPSDTSPGCISDCHLPRPGKRVSGRAPRRHPAQPQAREPLRAQGKRAAQAS